MRKEAGSLGVRRPFDGVENRVSDLEGRVSDVVQSKDGDTDRNLAVRRGEHDDVNVLRRPLRRVDRAVENSPEALTMTHGGQAGQLTGRVRLLGESEDRVAETLDLL